jgi:hypothetical protein
MPSDAARPQVFFRLGEGDARANFGFRRNTAGAVQSLAKVVYDGDTINVDLTGSGALRFLGVDTAEVKIGGSPLDSEKWQKRLADPATVEGVDLHPGLRQHLLARLGPDAALNHHRHALAAQAHLRALVEADIADQGLTPDTFRLFAAFSYEVLDGYARFLVFANRAEAKAPRPLSYNERMLRDGFSEAFFIWPNVAPFRDAPTVADAVPFPSQIPGLAGSGKLGAARKLVQDARAAAQPGSLGAFDPADPLILSAFEIRFLDRKAPPSRAVIDLGQPSDVLLHPQSYWKVPNSEDRLYVPAEFIPAFAARGWKLEGW